MYVVAQRNTATYKNFVTILVGFYVSILHGCYVCVYVYIIMYIYTYLMTFSSGGKAITAVISGLLEGLYLVFFGCCI